MPTRHRLFSVVAAIVMLVSAPWSIGAIRHLWSHGHFPTPGHHIDFVPIKNDVGSFSYCGIVFNFGLLPLNFEIINLPGGMVGRGQLFRSEVERWDAGTQSWRSYSEGVDRTTPQGSYASIRTWPGGSTGVVNCLPQPEYVDGEALRIVTLTRYSLAREHPNQVVISSRAVSVVNGRYLGQSSLTLE